MSFVVNNLLNDNDDNQSAKSLSPPPSRSGFHGITTKLLKWRLSQKALDLSRTAPDQKHRGTHKELFMLEFGTEKTEKALPNTVNLFHKRGDVFDDIIDIALEFSGRHLVAREGEIMGYNMNLSVTGSTMDNVG